MNGIVVITLLCLLFANVNANDEIFNFLHSTQSFSTPNCAKNFGDRFTEFGVYYRLSEKDVFNNIPTVSVSFSRVHSNGFTLFNAQVSVVPGSVTKTMFKVRLDCRNTHIYDVIITWYAMDLAPSQSLLFNFQNGQSSISDPDPSQSSSIVDRYFYSKVFFPTPFSSPPTVTVSLSRLLANFQFGNSNSVSVKATGITTTGFDVEVQTWKGSGFAYIDVAWVATLQ